MQAVHGTRGRFPITFSPTASNLISFVTEKLVPKYPEIMTYYKEIIHERLLEEVPALHPLRDPLLTSEEKIQLGEDIFWDFSVTRLIAQEKLSVDLYSEIVWVNEGQTLYMPPGYVHGSGPHPVSYGYSIRFHMYLTPDGIPEMRDGQGNIYDMRGDRMLAPVLRYFPVSDSRRFNMYVPKLC